ncbi:hypothetical protein AZH53_04575 [Methanomicrobiaceae archaeon CYW5]|uniref:NTP transferase domain-containing protein n=1 Tax=Methanovulcanius yangii TaxID=1789227 RepID=UPI0029CA052B|nr:NTP transferase domain-containing protein [Methanovulcanius yangii]MBT8507692.1 hypothetical protein [Methanovulcanius yangii]
MHALIVAGGAGSRLGMGEKPLVRLCGKPLLSHVTDAFSAAGTKVTVITSSRVPFTENWCRATGIPYFRGGGNGYVEDILECAACLELGNPFFTCVADLPGISVEILRRVEASYRASGKVACSVWVPLSAFDRAGTQPGYSMGIAGTPAVPSGLNILHGAYLEEEQEELQLIIDDERLALNINTERDLMAAGRILCGRRDD